MMMGGINNLIENLKALNIQMAAAIAQAKSLKKLNEQNKGNGVDNSKHGGDKPFFQLNMLPDQIIPNASLSSLLVGRKRPQSSQLSNSGAQNANKKQRLNDAEKKAWANANNQNQISHLHQKQKKENMSSHSDEDS